MRILFIAMADSIHTTRWINQFANQGWEVYLFPVKIVNPHPELRNLTVLGPTFLRPSGFDRSVHFVGVLPLPVRWNDFWIKAANQLIPMRIREHLLALIIRLLHPDIVHSLEMQQAGYLTLSAKRIIGSKFPTWIMSIWGSDIYLFSRLQSHRERVKAVLHECDYLLCECERDITLAKELGLHGKILPKYPATGGFNLEHIAGLRSSQPISSRRLILLKGYQNWAGRALVGLQALARCADYLQNYEIVLYSAIPDVEIAAEILAQETKLRIRLQPPCSHDEMLSLLGKARITIGLSISDGLSNSMVESMVMGAFPIQSCTACVDEWIEDGKSGFIVPPEDPEKIALAIRKALMDDDLVNRAAEINAQVVKERLDNSKIQPQVIKIYQEIYKSRKE
ncbi:MAG: glycosyltransferase family 4 protein [Dehalococcoidales bacterium]